jgi:hypothetical protein
LKEVDMKKNLSLTVAELRYSAELYESSYSVMSWHRVCNEIRRLDWAWKGRRIHTFYSKNKMPETLGRFRPRFEGSFVLEY